MKFSSLILAVILFFYSCKKAEELLPDTIPTLETEFIETRNLSNGQIPIIAWIGIPQHQSNPARYQEMSAAGITQSYTPFTNADAMEQALNMAQEAGLKLFVACPELISDPETTVKRFMNHPALAGYYLSDEPGSSKFPSLSALVKTIRAIDDRHLCYVNLLPNYSPYDWLGTNTYDEYIDLFLKNVPVQVLSFDHYPITGTSSASIRSNWYKNLETIADNSKKSGVPFWAFALSTSFSPHPVPTLAMLRLQVYSNLAYGAQGIQYFSYWTLTDPAINFNTGPINPDGTQTVVYQRIQEINKEIKKLSSIFSGAKVVSVSHTGKNIPDGTRPLTQLPQPVTSLTTNGTGAVVSVMQKGQGTFLVVVNRDFTARMSLQITSSGDISRIYKTGLSGLFHAGVINVNVEPGDVAIFKLDDRVE